MGIITLSRQIGAADTTIAPAVAERLWVESVDNQTLDRQVEQTGFILPDAPHDNERHPEEIEAWLAVEARRMAALPSIVPDGGDKQG